MALALIALPLFNYSPGGEADAVSAGVHGVSWFVYALIILLAWGVQAYFMKLANASMDAENIFLYMTLSGLLLIPVALWMTDFSVPIEYGWQGPGLAAITQILNAVGALTLVYAFRYGRALVVAPLANAGAPMITAIVSMIVLGVMPNAITVAAIALASLAAALLAIEPEEKLVRTTRVKALLNLLREHKAGAAIGNLLGVLLASAGDRGGDARSRAQRPVRADRGHLESGQPVRRLYRHDAGGLSALCSGDCRARRAADGAGAARRRSSRSQLLAQRTLQPGRSHARSNWSPTMWPRDFVRFISTVR